MNVQIFKYPGVRVKQTDAGNWLLLFSAPATEINSWAGIPQKRQLGIQDDSSETIGFRRPLNETRLSEIKSFYGNTSNVVQNSLLCATRTPTDESVSFEPLDSTSDLGQIVIRAEQLENLTLLELLKRAQSELEKRLPSLANQSPRDDLVIRLKEAFLDEQPEIDSQENEESVAETQEGLGSRLALRQGVIARPDPPFPLIRVLLSPLCF